MNKDGVYPSSIHFLSFVRCQVRRGGSRSNFGVEVARCSIVEVRGVVQVFQNCFTRIPNPSRSKKLGLVARILSDE